ncbi:MULTISPECIES: hypothetical protein [unclassified Pseudomonas]|uniref:hypothetical protein n=1 Tax=unclassified Pseudomonas TaxID=196821 RepID=UPI0024479A5B|nr:MULTISPECIES: hypothetical protein [unclassified Pseudomonas]MDH0893624.1 hypothetical protein [Pseudomonas sp. GD03875]MDH1065725.1 hypothetical protein [Pseudomonas sp. GD03985]
MLRLIPLSLLAFGLVTNHALGDDDIESQRASAKPLIPISSGSTSQAPKTMAYTPDGEHYLIGDLYAGVDIFQVKTAALVTKEPIESLFIGNPTGDPKSSTIPHLWYAGIIDDNTYYYAAGDMRNKPHDFRVNIQQINPPKRLHTHRPPGLSDTRPVRANRTYINYPDTLVNWHTGQEYPVRTFSPAGFDYALTDSGKIFSRSYPSNWAMLYDPLSDNSIQWKLGISPGEIVLTRGSRHVVAQDSDGACRVWPLPELKPVQHCGRAPWFASDGNVELVTDPAGDHFAAAWRKRVQVYQVEPYQRTFELEMNNNVLAMALSANGRLAISSQQDAVEVWDIPSRKLLGRIATDTFPRLLAISPSGDEILVHDRTLLRLRVPEPDAHAQE